ncbi:hypothetical protein KNU49_gp023 [Streptomyces phage EGole]|uniref:Uncharacterized protein n=1 Tax=Streptomyces phage EGole TaxID=2517973 RepID=A0A482JFP7_9CAUD|nr:hypothetical protein KNU49_gp023 [Streptomyces phage EGole]QBP30821.1 hypothetical protein SEA_EGOLE_23 [Streptomyces phage EGole]
MNSDNEPQDVFAEDASEIVQTIMLFRIYDVMMCIARAVNPDEAKAVFDAHSAGKTFSPPPSFVMDEEESDPDVT